MKCIYCKEEISWPYYSDWSGRCVCERHIDCVRWCSACGRLCANHDGRFVEDGRYVCNSCLSTEVTSENIDNVVRDVIRMLNERGFEDVIYDNFQCKIVDKTYFADDNVVGWHSIDQLERCDKGLYDIKETICILNHLPEIEFRSVLAHEILHSWQTRNNLAERFGDDDVSKRKVEGFAQMGSYLVYSEVLLFRESKYAEYKIKAMFENEDPYYGVAFNKIYKQFSSHGGKEIEKWHYIIRCARKGKLNV